MSNVILDNGIMSNASYGNLEKGMSASDYFQALTDSRILKPNLRGQLPP